MNKVFSYVCGALTTCIVLCKPLPAVAEGIIAHDTNTGQVFILGTIDPDTAEVSNHDASQIRVTLVTNGVMQGRLYDTALVTKIVFSGKEGDDEFINNTSIPVDATAGPGNDIIIGGDGNDTLFGGTGDDQLVGGAGIDALHGEDGNDTVLGGDATDALYGGLGADTLNGNEGNDVLDGGTGDDTLSGEGGDDKLTGGDGNDFLTGGDGKDDLKGELGNDEIDGDAGDDILDGGEGDDTLKGGTDNDTLYGGPGRDILRGNEANDVLDGGLDNDILAGDDGDDQIRGGEGDDGLDGGFGWDTLYGGPGNDTLAGGRDRDILLGEDDDDFLIGNHGIDAHYGGPGNDTLRGDSADDVMDGGDGINSITRNHINPIKFGIVSNPANDPDHTEEDKVRALEKAATVADNISFFWSFSQQSDLEGRLQLLSVIKTLGKKAMVQIQTQFLGEPAPPVGMPKTFADPSVRALFLDNVRRFAELNPEVINLTPEINFLHYFSPDEYPLYASLYQEAYQLIKQISPNTRVGVSFQYLFFRGFEQFDALDTLGPHDYIAFTTYPIWMKDQGHINSPADIQPDYYTWIRQRYPDETVIITEAGWPNTGSSDPDMQAEYVRRLPELMAGLQPESVNWTLMNDFNFFHTGLLTPKSLAFLEEQGVDPELLFLRLNNVGVHSNDGTPHPAWFEVLKLDFN